MLQNPIEWTSIQILLTPTGEQHLGHILRTYELLQLTAADRRALLHRVLGTLGKRELINEVGLESIELRRRVEALSLLERIENGQHDVASQSRMIDNLVWFRDKELSMGHLAEMLLVESADLQHYETSCLVLGAFVQVMNVEEYVPVFWQRLIAMVDEEQGEHLFHRCCRVVQFYDSLVSHIQTYLKSVRQVDFGMDVEWIGDRLEFSQIRRVVCLMLDNKSAVRQQFTNHLSGLDLDDILRRDLFPFLIYD